MAATLPHTGKPSSQDNSEALRSEEVARDQDIEFKLPLMGELQLLMCSQQHFSKELLGERGDDSRKERREAISPGMAAAATSS